MDTFTLYVVLRAARALDGADLATVEGLLRPDDEDLRIWRDDADPTVLRVSIDRPADDLDAALALGRALAADTVAASPIEATAEEVVAMDDERQLVWRAEP